MYHLNDAELIAQEGFSALKVITVALGGMQNLQGRSAPAGLPWQSVAANLAHLGTDNEHGLWRMVDELTACDLLTR